MHRDPDRDERDAKSSIGERICPSTNAPTIAAVAGSSASMSAKVARGSRAIASWSQM